MGARIGPGTYINPKLHSEFRVENKPEFLQFFGSTEERFKGSIGASTGVIPVAASNSLTDQLTKGETVLPGPGTYDPDIGGTIRKVATAAFKSLRKDLLFQGNELPGPGQYSAKNADGTLKNWQSNIGAFGTTEKRFMQP